MALVGIVPNLWFNDQAEEAAQLYTSLFPNSKIDEKLHYDAASAKVAKMPEGSLLTVEFELDGHKFVGLNGGPEFKFSEAISLEIRVDTQEEIDHYWNGLSGNGGQESVCGWLKDKFGVSWQVTPTRLVELLKDPDKDRAARAMESMLGMKKIVITELEQAADSK